MVLLKLILAFILCVSLDLYFCLDSGDFIIYRKKSQNSDRFVIQRKNCSTDIQASNCSLFGAYPSGKNFCECICPLSNATFTYRDGFYRCIDDKTIMKKEDCDVKLIPDKQNLLKTIKKGSAEKLTRISKKSKNGTGCHVDVNSSTYLGCDGSWYSLQRNLTLFTILDHGELYLYVLNVPNSTQVDGKVIKLSFTEQCQRDNKPAKCVLFKLEGRLQCPVDPFSKPTAPSTLTQYHSAKVTIATKTNETLPLSHSSAQAIPTTITTSNSLATESEKTASNKKETSKTKIIVIAVTANAVLIVIIAVLVLILCRMRKRQSRGSNIRDNEPYDEIPVGGESILVGNNAYARLNSTKKKKNARQQAELDNLKNFPKPSFEDVPYEIPLPAPPNEPKDESFSYASLYDTVGRKNRTKKKKRSLDGGVHSDGTYLEDLSSGSPITNIISSQNHQKDLVYSYAVPDHFPRGKCLLTSLPRPGSETNSEMRQSVASYDYAIPESPKKDKDFQPSNSRIDANLSTENQNSKPTVMSKDSLRSNTSGPYYHVLGNEPMQNGTGNASSEMEQPYDFPEAIINAAFEDIESTGAAIKENCEENKEERYLTLINQPLPNDLLTGNEKDSNSQEDDDEKNQRRPKITNVDVFSNYC